MRPREVVSFLLRLIQLSCPLCTIRIWHFASCPADLRRFSGHSGLGALVANIGSARRDARRNLLRPFEQQHTLPIRVPKEQPRINSHVTFTPDRARLAFMKLAAADV